jgi:serine/threonine protein kinase
VTTEKFSGMKVDVWALGVTVYCMVFNELPFWDSENTENEFSILEYILKTDVMLP